MPRLIKKTSGFPGSPSNSHHNTELGFISLYINPRNLGSLHSQIYFHFSQFKHYLYVQVIDLSHIFIMLSAKMWKSIIFHLIIISFCCPYVSCYSINATATSSPPTLLCLPDQWSALLQFKQEFAFQKPNFNPYYYICSLYYNPYYEDVNESYPKMKFWKAKKDCCSWDGVTCDFKTGQVVGLDLAHSWLQGPLHPNSSLFKLRHLQEINLSFNNFTFSPIPSEFGLLSRLTHLNLSFSMFSGNIPFQISFLTNLVSLDLSTFKFPDETNLLYLSKMDFTCIIQNMTNLKRLHLGQVNISSPIPESLANLSSLISLSLDGCGLHGNFPDNIFQLPKLQIINLACNFLLSGFLPHFQSSSSLVVLNLDSTKFSGKLPNSVGYLKSLNRLSLWDCNFVGPIPSSIWNLSQLVRLDLSYNHFNGHELPSTLGNLAKLTVLALESCEFSGELPSSIGNLTRLERLFLSRNSFTAPIPASIGNLKQLQVLNLSDNVLRGQIPVLLGNISLKILDLSYNNMDGVIPSFLFMLSSLKSLNLAYNQFTGSLFIQNISSSQLEVLNLQFNKLNGQIPHSMFKLVNLLFLALQGNKLSGTVELSNFSKLVKLQYLSLSYNSLSIANLSTTELPKFRMLFLSSCNIGEFPYFLKTQERLESLDLSYNGIKDQIPNWLWGAKGNMKLDYMDLSGNKLHGSLIVPPLSISYFYISNNKFEGGIHASFRQWDNLKVLDISNNHFGGSVPRWLCKFSDYLQALNLEGNNFEGRLHEMFTCGSMHNLECLDLSHNQFEGQIPQSLSNYSKLQILNLGHNQISDIFPFWLRNLTELQVLVLRSNKLYGPIWYPDKFWGFVSLGYMDLAFNNFSGSLPSEFFGNWGVMMVKDVDGKKPIFTYLGVTSPKYGTQYYLMAVTSKGVDMGEHEISVIFKSIDLSNNRFHGEIPSSIGNLQALISLNLSSNSFTGPIPSSIGNMRELESLDLSNNKLFGRIPQQLTKLSFLECLNLSQNQLTGPIPQGGQLDTFSSSSFEENPGLCGSPLSKKCEAEETPTSFESEEIEPENGFTWKVVVMGYGCGFVVGSIIGYFLIFRQGPTGLFWRSFVGRYIHERR